MEARTLVSVIALLLTGSIKHSGHFYNNWGGDVCSNGINLSS